MVAAPSSSSLLPVRTAVVLLIAGVVGICAGVLGYLSNHDLAGAALVGGAGAGAALLLFHTLVGR